MATNKNITMKQFNGTDYDTLYPKTKMEQVEGAYTQQQILADSTKTLYGLSATAVPDAAFVAMKNLSDQNANTISAIANTKAGIVTGSYTGTGSGNSVTITFPSLPKILFVYSKVATNGSDYSIFIVLPGYGGFGVNEILGDNATYAITIRSTVQGNSVSLTGVNMSDFNAVVEYGYIAIA